MLQVMKIVAKTLKNTRFDIEVKPADTVADVKKTIESSQGSDVYPVMHQKLLYNRKFLEDASTNFLDQYNLSNDSFMVIMSTKGRSTPSPSVTKSEPVVDSKDEETKIHQILNFGGGRWDKNSVIFALRCTNNNREDALVFLDNCMPTTTNLRDWDPEFDFQEEEPIRAPLSTEPLNLFPNSDAFCTDEEFETLRTLIRADPNMLKPVLMGYIGFPVDVEPVSNAEEQITDKDIEAMERLEAMGYDRDLVFEAFMECDRDEEITRTYLLQGSYL